VRRKRSMKSRWGSAECSSCPLLSDYSTADLFKLFKTYCPDGLTVFVMKDETRSVQIICCASIRAFARNGEALRR
jgi:hypothetical protein